MQKTQDNKKSIEIRIRRLFEYWLSSFPEINKQVRKDNALELILSTDGAKYVDKIFTEDKYKEPHCRHLLKDSMECWRSTHAYLADVIQNHVKETTPGAIQTLGRIIGYYTLIISQFFDTEKGTTVNEEAYLINIYEVPSQLEQDIKAIDFYKNKR